MYIVYDNGLFLSFSLNLSLYINYDFFLSRLQLPSPFTRWKYYSWHRRLGTRLYCAIFSTSTLLHVINLLRVCLALPCHGIKYNETLCITYKHFMAKATCIFRKRVHVPKWFSKLYNYYTLYCIFLECLSFYAYFYGVYVK